MAFADVKALAASYREELRHGRDAHLAPMVLFLGYERITRFDDFADHIRGKAVDWDKIRDQHWSSTEEFLVETAYALHKHERAEADMSRIHHLDDDQTALFLAVY